MQAVVGASAAPLGVPGVPVAPQGSVGQGLQGPAITTEALEDLGGGILAQESQGVHLPREKARVSGKDGAQDRGSMHTRRSVTWREVILRALSMRIQVTVSEQGGVLREP